jgi:hypothetical protein
LIAGEVLEQQLGEVLAAHIAIQEQLDGTVVEWI